MGIERYRAIVKLEDIRTLYEKGEYGAAKAAADGIRRERLKDSSDLFLLAAVYRKCGEYETAKELLYSIYEKKVTWRVLEELMEVCLAEKNPEEAKRYLLEYAKVSGGDPRAYCYEYRIGRQMHRSEEELLPLLQTLKAEEYTEKYAYELAKLYHKLGRAEECVAECSDLILWFGEGTYVERAKALRSYYRGELSVDDIKEEAERRVREAEEHYIAEAEARKAYELEQARLAEEARLAEAKEQQLAEEEHRALTAIWQQDDGVFLEEERLATEETLRRFEEEDCKAAEEPCCFEEYKEAAEAETAAGENRELPDGVMEEAAAADMSVQEEMTDEDGAEPMWETDASVVSVVAEETVQEMAQEAEMYEQISLFASGEENEPEGILSVPESAVAGDPMSEKQEEPRILSEPAGELAARLETKGIVLEEALHEFARIERVRKQLIRMLEMVVTVRKKCHCLIITGEQGSGKTTLGTYLAKLLYELSYVKSPKVAKINAVKLNGMKLEEKKEQLQNSCLIVECAGALTDEAAAALLELIVRTEVLGTVILEDNANAMNKLLRTHGECNRMFNNRVHLPKYDTNELMEFSLGYIEEQDYEIAQDAKSILYREIEHLTRVCQKEGRLVETMKLVKQAIENADYRNQGTILAMASAGNFLAAGVMELTAEDFGVIR